MLAYGNGQCHAWADLFKEYLRANKVQNVKRIRVLPPNGFLSFAVKHIAFGDEDPRWPEAPVWKYYVDPEKNLPDGRQTDDLDVRAEGLPGQNMPTPYAKLFDRHFLVHRSGDALYYDPSYGITTTGSDAYTASAVDGWGAWIGGWLRWCKQAHQPGAEAEFVEENW